MKRSTVIGSVVGAATLFLLMGFVVPRVTCSDGWHSPSIGRQGACSSHGGVGTSAWGFLAGLASFVVGGAVAMRLDRPSDPKQLETPYGTFAEYEAHLRKLGLPEEQIRAEISKYRARN